ncbi:hypothetical protein B0H11DRAFT_1900562 [Mycena galericulata]|nr:hypothetical protein B0H11DRAFT_1900562 [Mycena galericulata]
MKRRKEANQMAECSSAGNSRRYRRRGNIPRNTWKHTEVPRRSAEGWNVSRESLEEQMTKESIMGKGRRPERTQVDEHDGAGEVPCKEGPDRSRVAVSERPGQVGIAGNAEGGKECKDNAGIITDWSGKAD